ncbi:helix-turn-helix domain-containing protein [Sphingobacterium suaedae]|uniref:Helix-turn-helix domain-containing protein n=1 Tax=Sphingobacterium suaedae TaxID=1686402 RepID=A0ABW5KF55_9SPHI
MVPFLTFIVVQLIISIIAIWKIIHSDSYSRILFVILVGGCVGLLSKLFFYLTGEEQALIYSLSSTVCIVPFASLYIYRVVTGRQDTYKHVLLTFTPLVLSSGICLFYVFANPEESLSNTAYQHVAHHFRNIILFGCIGFDLYLLLTHRSEWKSIRQRTDGQLALAFLCHKFFLAILFILLWFSVDLGNLVVYPGLSSTSIVLGLILYFKVYKSHMLQPAAAHTDPTNILHDRVSSKYQKNAIDIIYLEGKRTALEELMHREHVFLDADISSSDLAAKLNMSNHDLSLVFSQLMDTNFYQYINGLRIDYFIKHIDFVMEDKKTILALAYESGFQSKSTFNKYFKQTTGISPTDYVKKAEMALS